MKNQCAAPLDIELGGSASPLYSVIIPVFNSSLYIQRAIDSVLVQSLQNFEIIIVDDASTDDFISVISKYCDPRIKVFHLPSNRGQSHARNFGIDRSHGEWVAFLDSDDWFARDRMESLIEFANVHTADVVADNIFIYDHESNSIEGNWFQNYSFRHFDNEQLQIVKFIEREIGIIKIVAKRSLFNLYNFRYDESIKYGEDYLLYLEILFTKTRFFITNKPFYFLRRGNTGSLTTSHLVMLNEILEINHALLLQKRIFSKSDLLSALKARVVQLETLRDYHTLIFPLRNGSYCDALKAFLSRPYLTIQVCRHIIHSVKRKISGLFNYFY